MESATSIKILNTLLLPTQKTVKSQKWLQPMRNPLDLRKKLQFLTHCTAKPHTNMENTSRIEPGSNPGSRTGGEVKPNTNRVISGDSRGLVFDLGSADSWDSLEIGSPVVKRYLSDEEERWLMWYHGRSGQDSSPDSDSIGLAVSSNGIHWERGTGGVNSGTDVGIVMSRSSNWWGFDTLGVRPAQVVIMSSAKIRANSALYWLYYTGFCNQTVQVSDESSRNPVYKSFPGLAMSQDGRHWARIEGEHHSGALFDVGSSPNDWDSMIISSPQVVFHETGDLRMYYHSYVRDNGCLAVGMARSRDGIRWIKLGKIIEGAMNPSVVRNRRVGNYVMAYEVVGAKSIGVAISPDGLKGWERVSSGPVLERCGGDDGWDCEGVGSPCLVQMDGDEDCQWRLYYRGVGRGGRTGIGLALSVGSDLQSFQRWTGFQL